MLRFYRCLPFACKFDPDQYYACIALLTPVHDPNVPEGCIDDCYIVNMHVNTFRIQGKKFDAALRKLEAVGNLWAQ